MTSLFLSSLYRNCSKFALASAVCLFVSPTWAVPEIFQTVPKAETKSLFEGHWSGLGFMDIATTPAPLSVKYDFFFFKDEKTLSYTYCMTLSAQPQKEKCADIVLKLDGQFVINPAGQKMGQIANEALLVFESSPVESMQVSFRAIENSPGKMLFIFTQSDAKGNVNYQKAVIEKQEF